MVGIGGGATLVRDVTALPDNVPARARAFAEAAGWRLELAAVVGSDADAALAAGAGGRWVLFVPPRARTARKLRRILVLHEGSPAVTPGLEAADAAAVATGASIAVVHVPSATTPPEPGSLPAPRFVDHDEYDWSEWRDEFVRRFCAGAKAADVSFDVVTGDVVPSVLARAKRLRADLVVVTWKGDASPGHAETVRSVLTAAPCPVLIVPERSPGEGRQTVEGRRMVLRPPDAGTGAPPQVTP
jgi:nucleotide-binding universal stress UspA family protein